MKIVLIIFVARGISSVGKPAQIWMHGLMITIQLLL